MMIREPKRESNRSKEVKVVIPVDHLVRLHSMKVLTGKHISDTVTEALDAYFARANGAPAMSAHAGPRLEP